MPDAPEQDLVNQLADGEEIPATEPDASYVPPLVVPNDPGVVGS